MLEDLVLVPAPPPPRPPCELVVAGITHPDPDYVIRRNPSFNLVVLEYVEAGAGFLEHAGQRWEPKAGDLYIIHPRTSHAYGSLPDNPWRKIWFNLRGPLIEDLLRHYGLDQTWHVPDCPLGSLFRRGLRQIRENPREAHAHAALLAHRILLRTFEHVGSRQSARLPPEAVRLRAFLEQHWNASPSLADMSRVVGRSPSQTIRIFRQTWGQTPHQFVLERKIAMAKTYLGNTAMTVQQIADALHFCDPNYFSAFFKRKTGHYPGQYRRSFAPPH